MTDTPLTVTTATASYPIEVGAGLLSSLPERLAALELHGALWLISDTAVYPHYGAPLEAQLRAAGRTVQTHVVPSGESSKDLAVAAELYSWMLAGAVERRDAVLALGGGVVGDLAGFVAATVLRGVALVQLPTTLLAMIDSAIGGKTGVNHPLGKNLIGAFHQPRLVLSDTDTLTSLPPRELRAGWAEVIKHGVIRDAGLFVQLEAEAAAMPPAEPVVVRDGARLAALIRRAAAVKVAVVNLDEREHGERMLLNYGHTLGHALEALAGYGVLLHGEAVAIGMDLAGQIAVRLGLFDPQALERQRRLVRAYGLPCDLPAGTAPDRLLELTLHDKKVCGGRVRWVLPTAIGAAAVFNDVPAALVRAVVMDAAQ